MGAGLRSGGRGASRSASQQDTLTREAQMAKFKLYQDVRKEYRWTFIADNGEPVFASTEGYTSKANCLGSISIAQAQAPTAKIDDQAK